MNAKKFVLTKDLNEIYVSFPSQKFRFELSDHLLERFPSVSLSKTARHIVIHTPDQFQDLKQLAQLLAEKGFGEQFTYEWNWNGKKVFYSPAEMIQA